MHAYRFTFPEAIDLDEVEATLVLSLMAAESLLGPTAVRLDAPHYLDRDQRACCFEAPGEAGRTLALLFYGFLLREFEPHDFRVDRPNVSACRELAT
jgi:hypothetical protein